MKTLNFARTGLTLGLLVAAASVGAADINNGAQIYNRHCAGCHGPSGVSVMPNAPNVARGAVLMQPDSSLLMSIRSGKNAMPGYMGILKDQEIFDVIAYMRTLQR